MNEEVLIKEKASGSIFKVVSIDAKGFYVLFPETKTTVHFYFKDATIIQGYGQFQQMRRELIK